MSPTLGAGGSAGSSDSYSDRQFIAITSEKTARVIALPSQNCVYRQQIADTDYVVKAEIISFKGMTNDVCSFFVVVAVVFYCVCISLCWHLCNSRHIISIRKWNDMECIVNSLATLATISIHNIFCIFFCLTDSVCLICYISTGHLVAYSLPSLRQLIDVDFLPLADLRYFFICSAQTEINIFPVLQIRVLIFFSLIQNSIYFSVKEKKNSILIFSLHNFTISLSLYLALYDSRSFSVFFSTSLLFIFDSSIVLQSSQLNLLLQQNYFRFCSEFREFLQLISFYSAFVFVFIFNFWILVHVPNHRNGNNGLIFDIIDSGSNVQIFYEKYNNKF